MFVFISTVLLMISLLSTLSLLIRMTDAAVHKREAFFWHSSLVTSFFWSAFYASTFYIN